MIVLNKVSCALGAQMPGSVSHPSHTPSLTNINMPHVTFGENYPARRSAEDSHTLVVSSKKKEDDDNAIVLRRSRSISYRIPEDKPDKSCKPVKPADNKICIERRFVYKDSKGNVTQIIHGDSCGRVIKRIYPTQPPAPQKECRPPSPPPKCDSPPPCEPSKDLPEAKKNCDLTKIVVRNGRGVVWKVVYLNCDGKTMKTEYPEPDAARGRSTETRRYIIKEVDDGAPRRRYSETKKMVIDRKYSEPALKFSSDVAKKENKSEIKKVVIDRKYSEPALRCSSDMAKKEIKSETRTVVIDKEYREPAPKCSDDTIKKEKKSETLYTVKRRKDSGRSEDFFPKQEKPESVTDVSSKQSSESDREVYKDENGVIKKVVYTDSRGRRRTVVYDD
jgi:hypothetical protein